MEAPCSANPGVAKPFDLDRNGPGGTYGEVFPRAEKECSAYNFEIAGTVMLKRHFEDAEAECGRTLDAGLVLPAYEQCLNASHLFNMLDARGVISATERPAIIARVRALAKGCCEAWLKSQGKEG